MSKLFITSPDMRVEETNMEVALDYFVATDAYRHVRIWLYIDMYIQLTGQTNRRKSRIRGEIRAGLL
jgi:hypothetical protein